MAGMALRVECDYVKLSCRVEHDVVQQHIGPHLSRAELRLRDTFGIEPRRKDTFLGDWGEGKRLYIFEYEGEQGKVWYGMDYWQVRRHVSRLDAKKKLQVTEEGLRTLFAMVERGKTGGRSFGWSKNPLRKKTDKRDSGGLGFAIGSHKSDYRIHVTKRGSESGYLEFMFKDNKLERMLLGMDTVARSNPSSPSDQNDVIERLYRFGIEDLCKIVGLTESEVYRVLGGGLDTGMSQLERDIERVELMLRSMPREAVAAIITDALTYKQLTLADIDAQWDSL